MPGDKIGPEAGISTLSESISKLQPDRTVFLRGFDTFAAAAAIHSATPSGFRVSGTFRDPADFAVAVLYDADNFFEHPSLKYLPDFNFSGLTLNFDLNYSDGLQPIDSPKYNWIDWATLDCIRADGTTAQVRLFDNAMLADATFPAASVTCNVVTASTVKAFDRLTLWYQNVAFDYTVPVGAESLEYAFFAHGTGTVHSITVNGRTYSHTETALSGESSADQATALIAAIQAAVVAGTETEITASAGSTTNAVLMTAQPTADGIAIAVSASDDNAPNTLRFTSAAYAAAQIVAQVNGTDWAAANTPHALLAAGSGTAITLTAARYGLANVSGTSVVAASATVFSGITAGSPILIAGVACTVASVESPLHLTLTVAAVTATRISWTAPRGGHDGNLIELYSLAKTDTLSFDQPLYQLSGGSSSVTWNCTVDFSARGIDQLRQCWLTFAPALVTGAYAATEWEAIFSHWQLTGPADTQALLVAGPGSLRIEQDDSACVYAGTWSAEAGFYSKYFARVTSDPLASVTITYTCQFPHDLWLGTSLYSDRANAGVRVDDDTETPVVCQLATSSAIVTRRQMRTGLAAGFHTVTLRPIASSGGSVFYFDFLEVAVASEVPNALAPRAGISPALDFDTDHTYKLPPARLMWIMDQLGYAGPMNEYLGVFWWNERKLTGGALSTATVSFGGLFADSDSVYLTLNGSAVGKAIFPADTPSTIATHFAASINGAFVGIRASASGPVLTITARSAGPAYTIVLSVSTTSAGGTVTITSPPVAGHYGTWVIDDTVSPPLNRAARDWHADFYSQCAGRAREVVTACSMELVNPPAGYAAKFPDGAAVTTSTGFGSLASNHCAIGATAVLAYQKAVYRSIAALQVAAGLTPCVQYGELLWWYLAATGGGMAFYDAETMAAAQTALGRPLHIFTGQDDDPAINAPDAMFLRNRLRDHLASLTSDLRAAHSNAICELLWPYDVNYPTQFLDGSPPIGGRLNRYVNLPVEWQSQATSGLDRIKAEALAFGSGMRNLDLAREAIGLFPGFGWPLDRVRYLVPVFGSAIPWKRELALALGAGITVNNLWAFDHVCLFNLQVPEGALERRSFVKAA